MEDAVARYRVASEANDIEAMMATLSPVPELVSPISGRMVFRGREDVRVLLTAVYGSIRDLHWDERIGEGSTQVLFGAAKVGPFTLGDAMVVELDPDGQIARIRPHLRPWLTLTLIALLLGPKVGRRPGVVWRALRSQAG